MPARDETSDQLLNQAEIDLSEIASVPYDKETALGTVKPLPNLPADANKAVVCIEGTDVRWRPDGDVTAPTATEGMILPAGSTTVFVYGNGALAKLRFIESAASAKLRVVYLA